MKKLSIQNNTKNSTLLTHGVYEIKRKRITAKKKHSLRNILVKYPKRKRTKIKDLVNRNFKEFKNLRKKNCSTTKKLSSSNSSLHSSYVL
jgi:ribosomal 50S subunit-associated protein YjgA (DUF615 family)